MSVANSRIFDLSFLKFLVLYLLIPSVVTLFIVINFLRLIEFDLNAPLFYFGEESYNVALIKSFIENGWWSHVNSNIATPSGWPLYALPLGSDNLNWLIIKIISFFTSNPFLVANTFYLLSFPLIAIVSMIIMKKLGFSYSTSLVIAIIFSFLPFHFFRNTNYLFLSNYSVVPIGVFMVFTCFKPSVLNLNTDTKFFSKHNTSPIIYFLTMAVIMASGGIYYAFFTVILLIFIGLLEFIINRSKASAFLSILGIATITLVEILNNLPFLRYISKSGINWIYFSKGPQDAETYGLKISQLLLPIENHRILKFGAFSRFYNQTAPLVNENAGSALGIIGVLGFLFLIFWFAYKLINHKRKWENERLDFLGLLNIMLILFVGVGGIGALVSYLIVPGIAGLNRASIFIGFISLLAVAILIDKLRVMVMPVPAMRPLYFIVIPGILIIGLIDILPERSSVIKQEKIVEIFRADQNFFEKLEASVPNSSEIFQLPYSSFPQNKQFNKIKPFDYLHPYLLSDHLRWSDGALKSSSDDKWMREVSTAPVPAMIQALKEKDFDGILIDRLGYEDNGESIEAQLEGNLGVPSLISIDSRYTYFKLTDFNLSIPFLTNNEIVFGLEGNSDNYTVVGWSFNEPGYTWTVDRRSVIVIPPVSEDTVQGIVITGWAERKGQLGQKVEFVLNNTVIGDTLVTTNRNYFFSIPHGVLNDNANNILRINTPEAISLYEKGISSDTRILGMAVRKIKFQTKPEK